MVYDLSDSKQLEEALAMLSEFSAREKVIEIKVIRKQRSLKQNNYLYLILGYMGLQTGYTLDESKSLYKQMNKDLYYYFKPTKDGEDVHNFIRSSRDLDEQQMAKSIDRLHKISAENGVPLPLATDQGWLREIEKEIERSGQYL